MIRRIREKTDKALIRAASLVKGRVRNIISDESGVGVVEVILILVVLIGLVLIFKNQLTALVGSIFDTINTESSRI